jgi:hypothetical protein
MTKAEAIANLLNGAEKAGGQFITVTREHLLIALRDEPAPEIALHDPDTDSDGAA